MSFFRLQRKGSGWKTSSTFLIPNISAWDSFSAWWGHLGEGHYEQPNGLSRLSSPGYKHHGDRWLTSPSLQVKVHGQHHSTWTGFEQFQLQHVGLLFCFVFLILQPSSISESQIYLRLRQNRAKLHQFFLPSSCSWKKIPITYTFFRPILLEVNSSRRTWACSNSKASTLPLHSTTFCTSAQFRSELFSTKAAWSHPGIAFLLQPLCLRRMSIPAFSSQAPPWLSPVMGFDLQLPNKYWRPRAPQSMQCWL